MSKPLLIIAESIEKEVRKTETCLLVEGGKKHGNIMYIYIYVYASLGTLYIIVLYRDYIYMIIHVLWISISACLSIHQKARCDSPRWWWYWIEVPMVLGIRDVYGYVCSFLYVCVWTVSFRFWVLIKAAPTFVLLPSCFLTWYFESQLICI